MRLSAFLFPRFMRWPGYILSLTGIALGVVRFWFGIKPALFDWKVFAINSSYVGSRHFTFIHNQMIEEVAGLLLLIGLLMIAFSRERIENEHTRVLRLRSFYWSVYLNTLFLVFAMLFFFGIAFVYMLIFNLFTGLAIYIIAFRLGMYAERKKALKGDVNPPGG